MRLLFGKTGALLVTCAIVVALSPACTSKCTRHSDCPQGVCGASGTCSSMPETEWFADAAPLGDAMSMAEVPDGALADATVIEGDGADADLGSDADLEFDAGVFDAGVFDAGALDADTADADMADAGAPDAPWSDAGASDAGASDPFSWPSLVPPPSGDDKVAW